MKYVQLAVFIGSMSGSLCAMDPNAMDPNMTAMMMQIMMQEIMEKSLTKTEVPILKEVHKNIQKIKQEHRKKVELVSQQSERELMEGFTSDVPEFKKMLITNCSELSFYLKNGDIQESEGRELAQECGECIFIFTTLVKFARHSNDENLLSDLNQFAQSHDISLFFEHLDKQEQAQ